MRKSPYSPDARKAFGNSYAILRNEGWTHDEIAAWHNVSPSNLDWRIRNWGEVTRIHEPSDSEYTLIEYRHFSRLGYTDAAIAEKLGMSFQHLRRQINDEGINSPDHVAKVLDRLTSTGEKFTVEHLPGFGQEEVVRCQVLIAGAVKDGRIRKIGKRPSIFGRGPVTQYSSAPAEELMAA